MGKQPSARLQESGGGTSGRPTGHGAFELTLLHEDQLGHEELDRLEVDELLRLEIEGPGGFETREEDDKELPELDAATMACADATVLASACLDLLMLTPRS